MMQLIFLTIQIIISVFLVISILLQKSSGDGLSGLSGSSSNTFISNRTSADFLTKATTVLAILFAANSLFLTNITKHNARASKTIIEEIKNNTPNTLEEKTQNINKTNKPAEQTTVPLASIK